MVPFRSVRHKYLVDVSLEKNV